MEAPIQSLIDAFLKESGAPHCLDSDSKWCLTLVVGENEDWIQLAYASLNLSFRDSGDALAIMRERVEDWPGDAVAVSVQDRLYATFEFPSLNPNEVAGLIHRIFRDYFGHGDQYDIASKHENFG